LGALAVRATAHGKAGQSAALSWDLSGLEPAAEQQQQQQQEQQQEEKLADEDPAAERQDQDDYE
jgi:hypothetical protein